ncbi:hypothetical protein [uncultured Sphingomonas sp.]|uniref:hypothetical protein n=1 Tax=uncultured Sphingomonas sp. TaxID=158754 RepID=UPI0025D35494|nr:hypothetical protein [uncultured Sphingomonas sp.]
MTMIDWIVQSRCVLACTLLAAALPVRAQTVTRQAPGAAIDRTMRPLPVHVGGRVEIVPAGPARQAYRYRWPGIYFEAAFRGDRLAFRLEDAEVDYRLLIDAAPAIGLAAGPAADIVISGLPTATHHVRLEKVSESDRAVGRFDGFFVPRDARPLPAKRRARQIEFIGDSSMTGYGMRSDTISCVGSQAYRRADTPAAYPALTAAYFGADYQVNARSGRGLVRNYAGSLPGQAMTAIYPTLHAGVGPAYHDA